MSSWNGFEDGDSSSGELLLSSPPTPSSPFSAAFRTPRPAGIQQSTAPKASTRSISVLQRRMLRSWTITDARLRLGTLPKHYTQAQTIEEKSTAAVQMNVK
jgi:hypothetical protein